MNERVARVFTYGAIPIARLKSEKEYDEASCSVLEYLGLPKSLVFGYVQPWVCATTNNSPNHIFQIHLF